MGRKPTENQAAVLDRMREIARPIRPAEVVERGHATLPWTESTARGRLESMARRGWVRHVTRRPATYALNELPAALPSTEDRS